MALTAKQKKELDVAAARREAGKATSTDVKNLDYATEKYDYKYVAPKKDIQETLNKARESGAISSPPGQTNILGEVSGLQLDGGTSYGLDSYGEPDFTSVETVEQANEAINASQDEGEEGDDIPTRRTAEDIMTEMKGQILPGERPVSDFTGQLEQYRQEYGIAGLESELNTLQKEQRELEAIKRQRTNIEEGKPVAMNVISGRVSEVERQENERIDAVQRQIRNVTDQLNTQYNVVNTLMKTEQTDYNNAVANYDSKMKTNIAMYNSAHDIIETEQTTIQIQQAMAQSNGQIMVNALQSSGVKYDDLEEAEKTNLTKLGVQSGLGANFYKTLLRSTSTETGAGKEVHTMIEETDEYGEQTGYATVLFKDGTTKVIGIGQTSIQESIDYDKESIKGEVEGTGLQGTTTFEAPKNDFGGTQGLKMEDDSSDLQSLLQGTGLQEENVKEHIKETDSPEIKAAKIKVLKFVEMIKDENGMPDMKEMAKVRENIAEFQPALLNWFDNTYRLKNWLGGMFDKAKQFLNK